MYVNRYIRHAAATSSYKNFSLVQFFVLIQFCLFSIRLFCLFVLSFLNVNIIIV